MRIDITNRPFPYERHEVRPPERMLVPLLGGPVFLVVAIIVAQSVPREPVGVRLIAYCVIALVLFAFATMPFRAGYGGLLPSRVIVLRGSVWITPKLFPCEQGAFLGGALASGAIGVTNIIYIGPGNLIASGQLGIIFGPVFVGLGVWGVATFIWLQLRGIKMTSESITYWRGIGRITLAWNELGNAISTNDVRDHEGSRELRDKYLPGAKLVIPVKRAVNVKFPVHWEDSDTPRLLLETGHFTVEPSALLTAILALRDNPELRSFLGARESKVLFKGPPWRVRRRMYRGQQWWPGGAAPDGIAVNSDGVVRAQL